MPINQADIKKALESVRYPGYSRDIVSFGMVKELREEAGRLKITIELPSNSPKLAQALRPEIENALTSWSGQFDLTFAVKESPAPAAAPKPERLPNVTHVIAVASGKGGVGKTTVAVNLARTLTAQGLRVGLLDADMHGPTVPLLIGAPPSAPTVENGLLVPFEAHGIKLMSMALLVDESAPVVWRGPMITKSLQQFVRQVAWGALDFLIVDLPPGTGDAQLALAQCLILDGVIIVTAPSAASVAVATRGAGLWSKLGVKILGVVENFSFYLLPDGTRDTPLGNGGGAIVAKSLGVPLLTELPIDSQMRTRAETGQGPEPKTPTAELYQKLAATLSSTLARIPAKPEGANR